MPPRRTHLGWLGPVLVLIGIAASGLGLWYYLHAHPKAGAVIDTVALPGGESVVVRNEQRGERDFVELRHGDYVVWQAIIPPYAGRAGAPGIATSPTAVTVRVVRDHHAEVFALSRQNGSKLSGFVLAPNHGAIVEATTGPVTLTDHERSYEIVSGPDWHQIVAIDLTTGEALWRQELGAAPIEDGGVREGSVWVQRAGKTIEFAGKTGAVVNGEL